MERTPRPLDWGPERFGRLIERVRVSEEPADGQMLSALRPVGVRAMLLINCDGENGLNDQLLLLSKINKLHCKK